MMTEARTTKYYSSRHEELVASCLGGSVVSGSGARDLAPGDVTSALYLAECKTHMSKRDEIVFYADVWSKICEEADSRKKFPLLVCDDGTQSISGSWVMTRDCGVALTQCKFYRLPTTVLVNVIIHSERYAAVLDSLSNSQQGVYAVFYIPVAGSVPILVMPLSTFLEVKHNA